MTLNEIIKKVQSEEYDFLRHDDRLKQTILLGLGGSHAYGTDTETSDLDIRGIALNSKTDLLVNNTFDQVVNTATDTTIYSFNKMISLLQNANPNTIEILGLRPDHYLYLSNVGQELLDNKKLFLSKKVIKSFGGYATSQLYRLNQKSAHQMSQSELENHIFKVLQGMMDSFEERYNPIPEDGLVLYTDKSSQENMDTEIFMDVKLSHYPLRDYCSLWNDLQQTVSSYKKVGMRNKKAIEHGKIAKHSMHLIRLYMMCLDILEKEEIITYRTKEHDLLMDIRNGKYLDENNQPIPEFFDMVHDYEKRLDYAKNNTSLPDNPNYKKINEFVYSVNERVVKGEL